MKNFNIIVIIFCIVLLFNYCRGVNLKCNSKYPKKNVKYCYFFVAINEGTYHNLVNCLPVKLKNQLYKIRYGKLPTVFKLTRMNLLIRKMVDQHFVKSYFFKYLPGFIYHYPTYIVFKKN
uniref:Uncharacterized protein n=1 Tax=Strongyloides stercoralis TaxID=6248 RepID=A0A0K0E5L4_STRER